MNFFPKSKPKADDSNPEIAPVDASEVYDFSKAIKPSLNLIPTAVREARGFAQTLRMSIVGLVALAGLLVIGGLAISAGALTANNDAANAASAATITQGKIASLKDVQAYYDAVGERKGEVKSKFSGSIDYSSIYGAVNSALPGGVTIDSFTTTLGTTCAGADPFQPTAAIGCATIQATAPDTNTISALTTALGNDSTKVLVDPYASSISDSGSGLSFKLTVNFTQEAYSDRFANYGATPSTTSVPSTSPAPAPSTTDSSGSSDTATGK